MTFEEVGEKAFSANAFDPYNSAETSSKWLVRRWWRENPNNEIVDSLIRRGFKALANLAFGPLAKK